MTQQSYYWAYAKTIIQTDTCNPKFIAILLTVARTWKQHRCLSMDEWIKKLWYIYTMEYSVQLSRPVMSDSLRPHELQHARPPCPSPTPRVHSNSRPSSQWCHPTISSSGIPFSSCPQSLPASESFPMSQLFAWGGHSEHPGLISFRMDYWHLIKIRIKYWVHVLNCHMSEGLALCPVTTVLSRADYRIYSP